MAFSLMCSAKKGISALRLHKNLDLKSYKTAWRMLRQIRTAMNNMKHGKTFGTIVEVDETYVGGKPRSLAFRSSSELQNYLLDTASSHLAT